MIEKNEDSVQVAAKRAFYAEEENEMCMDLSDLVYPLQFFFFPYVEDLVFIYV